ncbi:MAG: hypothetical protein EOP02_04280 [Proteobacteria bacterium]|nr:MAG: hypothetical protein EOP02_04280 [Pseudomonadota bacterium]
MSRFIRITASLICLAALTACVAPPAHKDYSALRNEHPRSILVVPVINRSVEVNAPDYFLTTIARPLAERGYYVFPVHMVKRLMEDDGLNDADMVHAGEPQRLGKMFGSDAIMYISIEQWNAKYVVFSTSVTVSLKYSLKSASTGNTLWENAQTLVYQPQNNAGGGLAGLIFEC